MIQLQRQYRVIALPVHLLLYFQIEFIFGPYSKDSTFVMVRLAHAHPCPSTTSLTALLILKVPFAFIY